MNLTEFSIRHHMAVLVACAGIVVAGMAAYVGLPRESFPDIQFPFITVSTVLDGGNPTDIEQSVTIPLETELDGLEGLKQMTSVSAENLSVITLEFDPKVDTQTALNRVRDATDQARADLPEEAEESIVKEISISDEPILIYHLVGSDRISLSELSDRAEKLEDRMKQIPGVLNVDRFGGREREVVIEVDPERLHYYRLSLGQVQQILRGTNRNVSAGAAQSATNRIVMRVPGEFKAPGEIFNLVVGYTEGATPIYMRDVATVRYDFEDEISRSRLYNFAGSTEGRGGHVTAHKSVSLQLKKRTGANILAIVEQADRILASSSLPTDVSVVKGMDQSKQVKEMVGDLENGIGTSLILVLLVILVGLGAGNAMLVASAIPFSMLLSILILQASGQTLNMMVLFSLILSLGMLVDNAIVIVENIYRYRSLGMPRIEAALTGTREVAWPVITSTATTVGAFLPLIFWPGIMGQFMGYLPRTVIIVLLSSLFVALVINPTLAALTMTVKPGAHTTVDPESQRPHYWLVLRYQKALEFLLDRPGWSLCTALVMLLLVFALHAVFGAGTEFFPPVDPDMVTCSIKPPEGVSLEESDRLARALEDRMFGAPGSGYDSPVANLRYASVVVGLENGGGTGFKQQNIGPVRIQIEFVDRAERTESTMRTIQEMRRRLEGLKPDGTRSVRPLFGAEYDVLKPQDGPPTGSPVSVDIFGEDLNLMAKVVLEMKTLMRTVPGTVKPTDDAVTAQPTLEWRVDRARAGMLGLDQATVSSILQIAVGGLKTGTFGHGDDEQDIVLRLPERYRLDTERLKNVTIPGPGGGAVPLASVASAELVPGPVAIKHHNLKRVLNASCDVQPGLRQDSEIRGAFQDLVKTHPFPPGITYRFGGAAEEEEAARSFLGKAFLVAVFIILVVMVLQFNSMLVAGIVLCSVVLSLMGVFVGLLLLHAPFGVIMTGIGIISLAGVVVNNAIVLLDAIGQFEARGQSVREAVVSAAMTRFRPVLLTAITTILGLVPMALKLNWDFRNFTFQYDTSSSQWWQSMSLAVIFGLLVATVLTLGVVPTLYLEYARWRDRA